MNPKVSIITINLNNLQGLTRTARSVFTQSFGSMEYIVIDGGSTDGSREFLEENRALIAHFESRPDRGVFHAMNKGIDRARGEYLLFLNSGDFLLHDHVLGRVFGENPAEDILCGTSLISREGKPLYYSAPPDVFTLRYFCTRNIPHQSTFIKRSLFEKFGKYREDFKINSDYDFWIRSIILGNCTTVKLDFPISDYNLEGISSKKENHSLSRKEIEDILTLTLPDSIVDDYLLWYREPGKMMVHDWFINKPALYFPMRIIYMVAQFVINIKKSIFR